MKDNEIYIDNDTTNPTKIVRFADGYIITLHGTTEEVKKKAEELHPGEQIVVIV